MSESADKGELILLDGGMCRWHLRKDGVVVVREILVLPACRRRGVASTMLAEVGGRNPGRTIRAKCPAGYVDGNAFWAKHLPLKSSDGKVNTYEGIHAPDLVPGRQP